MRAVSVGEAVERKVPMGKILGIAAVILLCAAIASAGERGASANTGPPSATKSAPEVVIGVQVAADLVTVAGEIGVIFNQTAIIVTTLSGDIRQWLDRIALFMSPRTAISSHPDELALMILLHNSLAFSAVADDSGKATTEVDPLGDTKILKGPRSTAFIHTGQNTVFC